ARRGGAGRLPLPRRFPTVLAREKGSYRSRRRALRHRTATQSPRGRRGSQMEPKPYPPAGPPLGPPPSPPCRWTARSLVRLFGAIAVGGRLDRALDLEHAAYPAPGGQATEEHGRGQPRARGLT